MFGRRPTASRRCEASIVGLPSAVHPHRHASVPRRNADAARIHPDSDAFAHQDVVNRRGHVVVFALDESRRHLDHGHVGAKPAEHLAELEADVTAADNRQVGGHDIQMHHRAVREVGNVVEAWQRGYGRTPANIDEDSIRVQRRVTDSNFVRRQEAGVSRVDGAPLQASKRLLDTNPRSFGNGSFLAITVFRSTVTLPPTRTPYSSARLATWAT